MKTLTTILITLFFTTIVFSQSMYVHTKTGQSSFVLSEIDSITFSTQDITSGLIAYYPFNGNANDESGNGNHGIVYGATPVKDRWAQTDSTAYYFNGSTSYIYVPNSSILQLFEKITVSVWIKFEVGGSYNPRILSKGYTNGFEIFTESGNATRRVGVIRNPNEQRLYSRSTLSQNIWYHIAYVYDGQASFLYINGILDTSSTLVPYQSTHNMIFGRSTNLNTVDNFKGSIDDIRIYNRPLSPFEIQALYREGGW